MLLILEFCQHTFVEELVCAALYQAKQESRQELRGFSPYHDYTVNLYFQGELSAMSA